MGCVYTRAAVGMLQETEVVFGFTAAAAICGCLDFVSTAQRGGFSNRAPGCRPCFPQAPKMTADIIFTLS